MSFTVSASVLWALTWEALRLPKFLSIGKNHTIQPILMHPLEI
jgi:hypothetical protein